MYAKVFMFDAVRLDQDPASLKLLVQIMHMPDETRQKMYTKRYSRALDGFERQTGTIAHVYEGLGTGIIEPEYPMDKTIRFYVKDLLQFQDLAKKYDKKSLIK